MATIITREVGTTAKGSPLTNAEIDNNFININNQITYNGPSIAPSLNLDFANSKQLDPRITFSRASTATYYDGKTSIKTEENLLKYSQDFSNAYWSKAVLSVLSDVAIAPDGTLTADKLVPDTSNNTHVALQYLTYSIGYYTLSIYVKAGEYSDFRLVANSSTTGAYANYNLITGTAKDLTLQGTGWYDISAFIVPVANGWYRCSLTFRSTVTVTGQFYAIPVNSSYDVTVFQGDGVSGLYVWGAQLEQRAFPTAYTPTTSSPITNYIPVLQTAASNAARIDHDPVTGECKGLLIEEQRTNLLPYSQDFDNPGWPKTAAYIYSNCAISPDGTQTADKFVADTSGTTHAITQAAMSVGSVYTMSIYAKYAGNRYIALSNAGANTHTAIFDLQSGVVTSTGASATSAIQSIGNSWYRCSISLTAAYSTASVYSTTSATSINTGGDGYSGVYIWGAQLEQGAFATSYIPTALTYSGRASTATYQGDDGFLATAAVNAPRYQRNAQGGKQLLLEGAGANILVSSNNLFTNFYKQALISSNAEVTSPAGDFTATKLADSSFGASTEHYIQSSTSTVTAGSYSMSLYVKAGNKTTFNLVAVHVGETSATSEAYFDLVNEIVTSFNQRFTSASISKAQNGWYRISAVYTLSGVAINQHSFRIRLLDGTSGVYSASAPNYCYVWGAQWEVGNGVSSYMPSIDTFTSRSSTATYFDSTGVLRTAPSGAARYGYGYDSVRAAWVSAGLLAEAQATNLLLYSEQIDGAFWGKSGTSIAANIGVVGPDGNLTADKLIEDTSNGAHVLNNVVSMSANTTYTLSVFAKPAGRNWLIMNIYDGVASHWTYYNVATGTIGTAGGSASIINAGNGWYRCTLTVTISSTGTPNIAMWTSPGDGVILYQGDGTSGVYLWGAQLEAGSVATSYIPTTSAQVTRAADVISSTTGSRAADVYSSAQATRNADLGLISGTNFSSWYRRGESTTFVESTLIGIGQYAMYPVNVYNRYTGTTIGYSSPTNLRGLNTDASNTVNVDLNLPTISSLNKTAIAVAANNAALSVNGAISSVDTSCTPPDAAELGFLKPNFETIVTGAGYLRKVAIYPKRLSNTELQALTTQ